MKELRGVEKNRGERAQNCAACREARSGDTAATAARRAVRIILREILQRSVLSCALLKCCLVNTVNLKGDYVAFTYSPQLWLDITFWS